jgi:hypothetical protein
MRTAILAAVATFASPAVSMSAFLLLIQAAAVAQSAAAMKTMGLASLRDTKVDALWGAMLTLKIYVENLCSTVDVVTARATIEAAGLLVASDARATKPLLSATFIPATGVVHLDVNAMMLFGKRIRKKTTFAWSWSTDGGQTWSAEVTTGYAHADIPSLPPATYLFRVAATVGKVVGEPTQPVRLILH